MDLLATVTSKIKQRQRVGATNAIARSKIIASYNINTIDRDDGGRQRQHSSNPNSNNRQHGVQVHVQVQRIGQERRRRREGE